MSKASQEANDLRQADAAQEQVRESDFRETAPEPDSPEAVAAEEARAKLKAVAEVKDLPSFEEAMTVVNSVKLGDNKAADSLSHRYGNKTMQYIKRFPAEQGNEKFKDYSWHCEGREDGPLTKEQSQELADALNSKIDLEKMKEDAAINKSRNERKKVKQKNNAPEQTDQEIMQELAIRLESIDDINKLKNLAEKCEDAKFLVITRKGVKAIANLEGSQKLADAFNSKKEELSTKNLMQEIENTPNSGELDKLAYRIEQDGFIRKEITGNRASSWKANAIEGKKWSQKLTDVLNGRREELMAEDLINEVNKIKTEEELEVFIWKVLHKLELLNKVPSKDKVWDVEVIDGKIGSKKIVNAVKIRRETIAQEADERRTNKARKQLKRVIDQR